MSKANQESVVDLVASYLASQGRFSADPELIAASLDLDMRQVRGALKELECDGVLDGMEEDDY